MMAKIKASPTQFAGSFCITTNTKKKPHRGCGGAASEQRGAWGFARTWLYKSAGRKAFRKKSGKSRPPVTKKRPRQSGGAISEQAPGGVGLARSVSTSRQVENRSKKIGPATPSSRTKRSTCDPLHQGRARVRRGALHSYRLDLNQLHFRDEVMGMRLRRLPEDHRKTDDEIAQLADANLRAA